VHAKCCRIGLRATDGADVLGVVAEIGLSDDLVDCRA
jgi:hypothetical protein